LEGSCWFFGGPLLSDELVFDLTSGVYGRGWMLEFSPMGSCLIRLSRLKIQDEIETGLRERGEAKDFVGTAAGRERALGTKRVLTWHR